MCDLILLYDILVIGRGMSKTGAGNIIVDANIAPKESISYARITALNLHNQMPEEGSMYISESRFKDAASWNVICAHELAHLLGFGALSRFNNLIRFNEADGTAYFHGKKAIRVFREKVPLFKSDDRGRNLSHWAGESDLYLTNAKREKLSKAPMHWSAVGRAEDPSMGALTCAALADIGWEMDCSGSNKRMGVSWMLLAAAMAKGWVRWD